MNNMQQRIATGRKKKGTWKWHIDIMHVRDDVHNKSASRKLKNYVGQYTLASTHL